MDTPGEATARSRATCPFCTLLCDDLEVERVRDPKQLTCALARERFESVAAESAGQARVNGAAANLEQAVDAAAALLRAARRPLFAGSSGDVAAMRMLLDLAQSSGAVVDHRHGAAMQRNLHVFQSGGWMSTNFGELKQRADLVVILDSGVLARHPRLVERFIAADAQLHPGHRRPPEVITIGGPAVQFPAGISVQHVPLDGTQLADLLGMLRCLLHERPLPCDRIGGVDAQQLHALLQRMLAARYGVVLWSAQLFEFEHADLTVHAAAELVAELNHRTRFACLPLAAGDGAASLQQVAGWKCGFPLRFGFGCDGPVYDPYHHDAARLLAEGEVDALLWLDSFDHATPPATDLPRIVLGRPHDPAGEQASVFIPIGLPGVDHDAFLFRGDAAAVPARGLRNLGLDSAASVLHAIRARYAAHPSETA